MNSSRYCFPLSIQTVLPEHYRRDEVFQRNLQALQEFGFSGVELNMVHPDRVDLADVRAFLREFNLEFTMLASGLTAKTHQLSLSSPEPEVRERSVKTCLELIEFVAGTGAGIIIGFLKGAAGQDIQKANVQFSDSLRQISPYAAQKQVRILIEATNRYESAVANSLSEAVELIADLNNLFLRILPDTFHMNIEEADPFGALTQYAGYYDSIHLSDNNRYFPGLGAIKFDAYIQFLKRRNYQGGVAIEGNLKQDFITDLTLSMNYLMPLLDDTDCS